MAHSERSGGEQEAQRRDWGHMPDRCCAYCSADGETEAFGIKIDALVRQDEQQQGDQGGGQPERDTDAERRGLVRRAHDKKYRAAQQDEQQRAAGRHRYPSWAKSGQHGNTQNPSGQRKEAERRRKHTAGLGEPIGNAVSRLLSH